MTPRRLRRRADRRAGQRGAAAARTRRSRCSSRPDAHLDDVAAARDPGQRLDDGTGPFPVPVRSPAGIYRVVVTPGRGYSPAASTPRPWRADAPPAAGVAPRRCARRRGSRGCLHPERPARRRSSGTSPRITPSTPGRHRRRRSRPSASRSSTPASTALPEFQGRIAVSKSFVGGSPLVDDQGHGTFVAGEIAANARQRHRHRRHRLPRPALDREGRPRRRARSRCGRGRGDPLGRRQRRARRSTSASAACATRPTPTGTRTRSSRRSAVAYAYAKGAVVVAAVGNSDEAPTQPWPYASYPAALPHVIGVSALTRSGNVPDFSNRDAIYNDLAAPGVGHLLDVPAADDRAATRLPADQGYSDCGPDEYRNARRARRSPRRRSRPQRRCSSRSTRL